MIDLIFINLYGNIIPTSEETSVRDGFFDFLEKNKNKKIALTSYALKEQTRLDMERAGISNRFHRVYSLENMAILASDSEKPYTPQLHTWVKGDFKTSLEKTLCISSDPRDIDGAKFYGIKTVWVPPFESKKNDAFSFNSVKVDTLAMKATYFCQKYVLGKPQRIVLE